MARLILVPSPTGGLRLGLSGGSSLHCTTDADGSPCCCGGSGCCIHNESSCDELDPLTCCECGESFDITHTGSVKVELWNFTTRRLEVYFQATFNVKTRVVCSSPEGSVDQEHLSGTVMIIVNRLAAQNGLPTSGTRPARQAGIGSDFRICGLSIKEALAPRLFPLLVTLANGSEVEMQSAAPLRWWGQCAGSFSDPVFGGADYVLSSSWGCLNGSIDQTATHGDPGDGGDRSRTVSAWAFAVVKPCSTHPCGGAAAMTCDAFWAAFLSGNPAADLNGDGFIDVLDYEAYQNLHPECTQGSIGGRSALGEQVRLLVRSGAKVRVRR